MVQNSEAHLPGQLCRESPGKEWIQWELLLLDSMLLSENQGNVVECRLAEFRLVEVNFSEVTWSKTSR